MSGIGLGLFTIFIFI